MFVRTIPPRPGHRCGSLYVTGKRGGAVEVGGMQACIDGTAGHCRVGGLISGTVRRIDSFGCFVGLEGMGKISGLLHISNVSRVRVEYIEVRATTSLQMYPRFGRNVPGDIILLVFGVRSPTSLATPLPPIAEMGNGDKPHRAILRMRMYGDVHLRPGPEPVFVMSLNSNISLIYLRHIQDVFKIGDKVRAVILGMDEDFTRISLSTAELEEKDGDMVENKVTLWSSATSADECHGLQLCRAHNIVGFGALRG